MIWLKLILLQNVQTGYIASFTTQSQHFPWPVHRRMACRYCMVLRVAMCLISINITFVVLLFRVIMLVEFSVKAMTTHCFHKPCTVLMSFKMARYIMVFLYHRGDIHKTILLLITPLTEGIWFCVLKLSFLVCVSDTEKHKNTPQ